MNKSTGVPGASLAEPEDTGAAEAFSPAATPAPPGAAPPPMGRRWSDGAVSFAPLDPNAPWSMSQQWPNLVAALSEQAVEGSNLMLRALNYLVGAGRLRHSEARALSEAMQQLRATSLRAQQITRLAGGRIRQARERVDLADVVRHVLRERAADLQAGAVSVTTELESVDVLLDPPVAMSLLNGIVDWGSSFGQHLHLALAATEWPGPARLKVRVATPPPAAAPGTGGWRGRQRGRRLNDGLHWMLLRQIAASSSLEVTRSREDGAALLTIDFPKTFLSSDGLACLELSSHASALQRDSWVLVVARDAALRGEALEALRKMGIEASGAPDTEQARGLCAQGRPQVLVSAYDVPADDIAAFRREVLGDEERCPLVEITRELPSFHLSGFDRFETPKVGREQLAAELPPTVLFELVKI